MAYIEPNYRLALKQAMERRGLDGTTLAELSGVTGGTISFILSGKRVNQNGEPIKPSCTVWDKLAGAMNMKSSTLTANAEKITADFIRGLSVIEYGENN